MAPEATLPPSDVNVPGDYFSLAGFEVTMYGRFWVSPEAQIRTYDYQELGVYLEQGHPNINQALNLLRKFKGSYEDPDVSAFWSGWPRDSPYPRSMLRTFRKDRDNGDGRQAHDASVAGCSSF